MRGPTSKIWPTRPDLPVASTSERKLPPRVCLGSNVSRKIHSKRCVRDEEQHKDMYQRISGHKGQNLLQIDGTSNASSDEYYSP